MLVRVIEYLKLKRKSKRFMFSFVVFMLSIITGFSYAIFMISTDKYRVSEMFIANLMYGINISDSDNTSTISGKEVTVGVGTTEIINVTLTSLNPVDSNYKLQYKILSGTGDVYYSDRTNWMPYGSISKSNEGVYVKTIKIVIENTGTGSLTVEIGASGGYAYNSVNSVALISGYTAITEEKTTVVAIGDGELLKELVEKDTSCDTTESGVCLHGGKVLAKMISETSTTSTYTNAVPNLNSFYNGLEYVSDYILPTNKFLCTGSNISCGASSKFSNIGLINVDEYNKIGGINSYLGSTSSYFSMTEANSLVSNITSSGIEEVSFSTSSGLRPTIYLQGDLKVTGTGKVDDPYIIVPPAYNVTIIWRLNGEEQSGNLPLKGKGYKVESVTCDKGAKGYWDTNAWELKVENLTADSTCIIDFKYDKPLYAQVLEDNPNVETRTDFSTIFTESNNGNTIYKASGQDGKDTYYFAGQVTNNYVKFADKYWRIVRINEDNSVRLIYAGTSATDTAAFISTSQAYSSSKDNSSYVGYMYTTSQQHGTNTNSPIKTTVDNWYASNLNSYSGYISKTAIYCNDRTVASGTWSATGSTFYYGAYTRLYTKKTPTFVCSNANDRFTASTTTGNGKLTYPIGLITADEISYAGGLRATTNSNYYIAQNASSGAGSWWTMSPYYWSSYHSRASVFSVGGSSDAGRLHDNYVGNTYGVRPVISLKACVTTTGGDGTADNPYEVGLTDECANAENEVLEENTVRVSATTNDASMATVNAPSSVVISSGSSYTFTLTVNSGYEYESVSGCNGTYDTSTNKLTVSNVTSNTTCQVNFISNNHTVNMNVSGGTISPTSATVSHGSSKTFTVTASTGYTTAGATVSCTNGVSGSISGSTVTVSNVTSDTTCQVNFKAKTYTVNMNVSGGTISPTSATASHGSSKTFTVTASTGYTTTGATVSCTNGVSGSISGSTVTVSNVTSNTTCSVTLPLKTYTVSAAPNSTTYATVNSPSSVSVSHGGSHTFTFSVKTGYEYSSLSNCAGGSYNKNTNTLTVSNVTSNRSCTVNFKAKTYTITFNARGGTGGPTTVTKTHGVTLTLPTTKPTRSGYTFVEWNTKSDGTGTAYAPGASYTGNANATLYARWLGSNTYTVQATSTNAGWYDKWTSNWYNNYYEADHERVGRSSTGIPYAINILFDLEPYKNKEITKILLYIYVIDEATWQFSIDHKYNNTATGPYTSQAWATVGYNDSGVGYTKRKHVYRSDTVEGWNAIDLTEYGLPDYGYVLGPYSSNVTNYWRISRTASSGGKPYLVITVKEEV